LSVVPNVASVGARLAQKVSQSGGFGGKTYIRFRLQVLAKALEFKEFQIWQVPCLLNRIRLQRERVELARVRCNLRRL